MEAVGCCRLLRALGNSSLVKAVESVVKAVDCCRLLCALVLLKLLNLLLLNMLIDVGYIMCSREI